MDVTSQEARKLLDEVRQAREQIEVAKREQRKAVTAALDAGISAIAIGEAVGVTRYRVYQIRDGR